MSVSENNQQRIDIAVLNNQIKTIFNHIEGTDMKLTSIDNSIGENKNKISVLETKLGLVGGISVTISVILGAIAIFLRGA
jgi:hypothetical protein